jgi:hypothetical protein
MRRATMWLLQPCGCCNHVDFVHSMSQDTLTRTPDAYLPLPPPSPTPGPSAPPPAAAAAAAVDVPCTAAAS